MPHLRLEHTIEISANATSDLFKKLVDILTDNTTIQSSNCKSRAIKIKNHHMGSKNHDDFIHLDIILLEGRNNDVKQKIGEKALDLLKSYFQKTSNDNIPQISLEIREMKQNNYFTTNSI